MSAGGALVAGVISAFVMAAMPMERMGEMGFFFHSFQRKRRRKTKANINTFCHSGMSFFVMPSASTVESPVTIPERIK